jgi:hypothetical protein
MNLTLLTAYTDNLAFGVIGAKNKRWYCRKHGYKFVCETQGFDLSRPPAWSKIIFVQKHLPECHDVLGLNAGHFFIRNTPWSFVFL